MSATILDIDEYCKSVGLDRDEVKFIQVAESEFPVESRLIYELDAIEVTQKTLQYPETWDLMAQIVDYLMNKHKHDKGIIHVTTYKQLDFIKANISEENRNRLIETKPGMQGDEREMVIKKHKESIGPSVLISPSLIMGLDLKDDESRFQVVVKMPYGDLGDGWTNAKRMKNNKWYDWNTMLRLIQACGRSVRSKDDHAETYIVDSKFRDLLSKNKGKVPAWFMESIRDGSGIIIDN